MKKKKKKMLAICVGVNKDTIKSARGVILEIMKVGDKVADSSVKVAALSALSTLCDVNNTTISNNCFDMK